MYIYLNKRFKGEKSKKSKFQQIIFDHIEKKCNLKKFVVSL